MTRGSIGCVPSCAHFVSGASNKARRVCRVSNKGGGLFSCLLFLCFLSACATDRLRFVEENKIDTTTRCRTGALTGRLCHPEQGGEFLGGAEISVTAKSCDGTIKTFEVKSKDNGEFTLTDIPVGDQKVKIDHRDLKEEVIRTVKGGEVTSLMGPNSNLPRCVEKAPKLAVVTGMYDSVEKLLKQMDMSYELYDGGGTLGDGSEPGSTGEPGEERPTKRATALLRDLEAMKEYDVLFFNCGNLEREFIGAQASEGDELSVSTDYTIDYTSVYYENLRKLCPPKRESPSGMRRFQRRVQKKGM